MPVTILITGASGFIGSFLVQEALDRGYIVWAGLRSTSSRKYLTDSRIHFLEMNCDDPDSVERTFTEHSGKYGKFDYIIHCAGLTKTSKKGEFDRVNFLQTKLLIDKLIELNIVPKQFIYLSTLSVYGPVHEKDFTAICEKDIPVPNTEYGRSKLKAEQYIQSIKGFPYVIYRPTGVYGPREKDYYLMAKSIKNHIDFSAGLGRQDLTFVYVKDLVKAVYLGIEKNITQRAYFISDGKVQPSSAFSRLIQKELGNPFVIRVKCPLFILKGISSLTGFISGCLGKSSTLNTDKYKIMKQRNWRCDINLAVKELGFVPDYDLEAGVKETIAWYKSEKWL